jgi:hypothetical protein
MAEQPPPQLAEIKPETIEVLASIYQEWKRDHPEGTWHAFWAAVAAGEMEMPG